MILFLDNAESVLDPKGTDARDIYSVVEELSRFKTVCLCITSRISTAPRHCKRPIIPTLSMESACEIFYGIYDNGDQSDIVTTLLRQLDFHALSITLLATTASHNMWDYDRLAREWNAHRVQILRTDYNESLAAAIELSLASPTFHKLGPDAHDLLGVIAFLPQGISEDNIDWLFPNIHDRRNIFDKFCTLSLTHRGNGFITMLAPLRDHFCPKDPMSSPLLCATKERYFSRLSVHVYPGKPGFEEARWITSEDVNVEHLIDVYTTIDTNPNDAWIACDFFMTHLHWHKTRLVVFKSKIEGLPDHHSSKPRCLFRLSWLFGSAGNFVESKRLLVHTLEFWREPGDGHDIASTLGFLSHTNRRLGLLKEGIEQVKEALEMFEWFDDELEQARLLRQLARLLYEDKQLDAVEETASRVIDLLPDEGEQYITCQCHRVLGDIHRSRGEAEKAIEHFETALGIASPFEWYDEQFWIHHSLAILFSRKNRPDDTHAHVRRARSHAINSAHNMGRAMELQAQVWYDERKFKEAEFEALGATYIYEKIGATKDAEYCRAILQSLQKEMETQVASGESDSNGEFLETVPVPTPVTQTLHPQCMMGNDSE